MRDRALVAARCLGAGVAIAAAVPPWGWWPLAFVGVALLDGLLADQPGWVRFRRGWLVAAAWLGPSMLWMWWLTAPGYVVAVLVYSALIGAACAAVPSAAPWRWAALPAALVLAEWVRWSQPFEGVPLSTLAMGQAAGPLAPFARVGSALGLAALVPVVGVAIAALAARRWRPAAVAGGVLAVAALLTAVAPRSEVVGELRVAAVQGGGPQGTRAADTDEREVFERHLAASELVEPGTELVLWPENVVNVEGELIGNPDNPEGLELADLARELDAVLIPGIVEGVDDERFLNASIVFDRDGEVVDRFDKVHRVPFGEYVPLRSLIEQVASGIPGRDADAGTGPGVLDTPVGRVGVVISWEVFFPDRGASGIAEGGLLLLNPTNGASYTLTQVQSQQIASSRLRALESDRWLVQAAPTGFSAIVDNTGEVLQRTAVSEQRVLHATVELRSGTTWAVEFGDRPTVAVAIVVLAAAWVASRRSQRVEAVGGGDADLAAA